MANKTKPKRKKRRFHGNRFTNAASSPADTDAANKKKDPQNIPTASSSKLNLPIQINKSEESEKKSGFRLLDLKILESVFSLLCCPKCLEQSIALREQSNFGWSSGFTIRCKNCDFVHAFCSSNKHNKSPDINVQMVLGLRLIGKGYAAAQVLSSTLNMLSPSPTAFRHIETKLHGAAVRVSEKCMENASKELRYIKKTDSIGVSMDGTWQRRGFSSLNGCMCAISVDTGKVLDYEVMSQYCRVCDKTSSAKQTIVNESRMLQHVCKNHEGSSASMEWKGAMQIFNRCEAWRNLKYVEYYGDGDSKGFTSVKDTYGKDSVVKQECIGHIQKRVGGRLRKLKGPHIRGKGKLTDKFINRLQNYYGNAIRSNVGDLDQMQSAVIAAFFHCCSSKEKNMHGQCPPGNNSWCGYQRALAIKKKYVLKQKGLSQSVVNIIKPIYMQLCNRDLLQKCLHGKTQNANEAFNGVLWSIIPKTTFVELQTLEFGASLACIKFNCGLRGILDIFKHLTIETGYHTSTGYNASDISRVKSSSRHSTAGAKKSRKRKRALKKFKFDIEEEERNQSYNPGGH